MYVSARWRAGREPVSSVEFSSVELQHLLIALITLAACFTQTVSGFGSALVAMPLFMTVIGLETDQAAPLMVLVASALQTVLLIRYRRSISISSVAWLSVASFAGIPLGMYGMKNHVPEWLVLAVLGVILLAYSAYALTRPRMPRIKSRWWALLAGFLAGVLGGAYTTNGPPAVVYGDCRGWEPDRFKSNLQGFFVSNNLVLIGWHVYFGNFTWQVGGNFLAALPGMVVGILGGLLLSKKINPVIFRKIMLCLVAVLAVRLLARAIWGV